jgi:hypothetical protein
VARRQSPCAKSNCYPGTGIVVPKGCYPMARKIRTEDEGAADPLWILKKRGQNKVFPQFAVCSGCGALTLLALGHTLGPGLWLENSEFNILGQFST